MIEFKKIINLKFKIKVFANLYQEHSNTMSRYAKVFFKKILKQSLIYIEKFSPKYTLRTLESLIISSLLPEHKILPSYTI